MDTGSSIIDTILVCRTTGSTRRQWLFETPAGLAAVVAADLVQLTRAGRVPTVGDTRCICFGHLTRMTIWQLRGDWDRQGPMREKLAQFAQGIATLGNVGDVLRLLKTATVGEEPPPDYAQTGSDIKEIDDAVPF